MQDFLLFLAVGFLAQIVDGALGMAYGVRTAGHIGVDAVVKLCSKPVQKVLATMNGKAA